MIKHHRREIREALVSTVRLETFSDGVIAIILILMILEVKVPRIEHISSREEVWAAIALMTPHLLAYILSFAVIAVLWVNHHNLFHQIQHTNRMMVWMNINLLFWMSLIPLPTAFLGEHPLLPEATMFYGIVMFAVAVSFTLMRWYGQDKAKLYKENISERVRSFYARMNIFSTLMYFISIFAGYWSAYISIGIFILMPLLYFMPKPIEYENE